MSVCMCIRLFELVSISQTNYTQLNKFILGRVEKMLTAYFPFRKIVSKDFSLKVVKTRDFVIQTDCKKWYNSLS